jgi:phosphoenolpyruvate-protein kinase (PTS system EI component)
MGSARASLTGSPSVDGIAIGQAVVWIAAPPATSPPATSSPPPAGASVDPASTTSPAEEARRVARAHQRAIRGVEELVRSLAPAEAELFVPELAILAELGPLLDARTLAGATAEQAIVQATARVSTDLLLDARARLLDGLGDSREPFATAFAERKGDLVLVTNDLTPSLVASLPAEVVGIVATPHGPAPGRGWHASHAVILARGRGIPLAFVAAEAFATIRDGEEIVLDTTANPARICLSPDDAERAAGQQRRGGWDESADDAADEGPAEEAIGVEMHVNIGSVHERFPRAAAGIGLVRTELLFSGHHQPPSELEQLAALRTIATPAGQGPMVVRLFDAGGDKPLPFLPAPPHAPNARGIELLFLHPELLEQQLRAIVRAAEHTHVRVLLPLVRTATDVQQVRERTGAALPVGAMVETPAAVDRIDELAACADFICVGTNDLFSLFARPDSGEDLDERRQGLDEGPLDPRALAMIERVVARAHAHGRRVTVCGEMAGDARGAVILVGLGVDALSVAPSRFAKIRRVLRATTRERCRDAARIALAADPPAQ